MKELVNDALTAAVYESSYKEQYSYEVFLEKLNFGFELLEKNKDIHDKKKRRSFELAELEAIKFALEYNQAKLIKLLKEDREH
jgi:hypothetical protein